MKAGIGVAVLVLLLGAYFMFGSKKETPPEPEPTKIESKAETEKPTEPNQAEVKPEAEKPLDPAAKAEKLKAYAEAVQAANEEKKQDATQKQKLVFLVEDVRRTGSDLLVSGHFYNGKKDRTITTVKQLELDIVLRDLDTELLNVKDVTYDKAFTGLRVEPLKDSPILTINLLGQAPEGEFNNFTVDVHDVHWEGVGK